MGNCGLAQERRGTAGIWRGGRYGANGRWVRHSLGTGRRWGRGGNGGAVEQSGTQEREREQDHYDNEDSEWHQDEEDAHSD